MWWGVFLRYVGGMGWSLVRLMIMVGVEFSNEYCGICDVYVYMLRWTLNRLFLVLLLRKNVEPRGYTALHAFPDIHVPCGMLFMRRVCWVDSRLWFCGNLIRAGKKSDQSHSPDQLPRGLMNTVTPSIVDLCVCLKYCLYMVMRVSWTLWGTGFGWRSHFCWYVLIKGCGKVVFCTSAAASHRCVWLIEGKHQWDILTEKSSV